MGRMGTAMSMKYILKEMSTQLTTHSMTQPGGAQSLKAGFESQK